MGRRGEPLSRSVSRLGLQPAGPLPRPVVEAVREQLAKLIHVPNTWHTEVQGALGQGAVGAEFRRAGVLLQLGPEANEAAIKLARLHTPKQRYKIITFEGGFHGRTLGATTATAQPKYHEGLGPADGRLRLRPLRRPGRRGAIDRRRDGRHHDRADPGRRGRAHSARRLLCGLRKLADEHELLLIFDEVQTGCGRTGDWFAYQGFRRHARRHDAGQGDVRRPGRRGHADHGRRSPRACGRACTPPPSAATRWRWRPALRRSDDRRGRIARQLPSHVGAVPHAARSPAGRAAVDSRAADPRPDDRHRAERSGRRRPCKRRCSGACS